MNRSDRKLGAYLGARKPVSYEESRLKETLRQSMAAFYEAEAAEPLSYMEFLYQQSRFIQKRWWFLQGALLFLLWLLLAMTTDSFYIQRMMGIAASLFAVLLLPELWKNQSANALEIENAAYYSLRQIYSARIFLSALVDLCFLSLFVLSAACTGKITAEEIVIQFFLPYIVTCCICFRTLYGAGKGSESLALFLCMLWCAVWTQFVLNEKIYEAVSLPVWLAMTAASAFYLGYWILRGQKDCGEILEVRSSWN